MKLEPIAGFEQKLSFEEYYDHIVSFARQTIVENGSHAPVLIVNEGMQTAVYELHDFYREDDPGRVALNGALATRYKGEANWFIQITEVWLGRINTPPGSTEAIRPSQDPERMEALDISGVRRDGERRDQMYLIVRDSNGVVVGTEFHKEHAEFLSILEHPLFGGATREFEGMRLVVEDD